MGTFLRKVITFNYSGSVKKLIKRKYMFISRVLNNSRKITANPLTANSFDMTVKLLKELTLSVKWLNLRVLMEKFENKTYSNQLIRCFSSFKVR